MDILIKLGLVAILGCITFWFIKIFLKGDGLVLRVFRNFRDINGRYISWGSRGFDLPIGIGFDKLNDKVGFVLSRILLLMIILGLGVIIFSVLIN